MNCIREQLITSIDSGVACTRKVSHKKVCGFCNFVHILWKVTKLRRKLASDVTLHKILICVKSQGKYICGCHKILSLC